MRQRIELEVDMPDGYEATGECRLIRKGDWFFNACGNAEKSAIDSVENVRIILRRKEPTPIKALRAFVKAHDQLFPSCFVNSAQTASGRKLDLENLNGACKFACDAIAAYEESLK